MDNIQFIQDEPLIITVSGGYEKTGKSLVSTNMAILFAQAGMNTILIDHDLSDANRQAISDFENGITAADIPYQQLESFLVEEGIPNLLMIPGSNLGLEFSPSSHSQKEKFFQQIREISSASVIIIDIDGFTSEKAIDIFLMSHAGLVVTTPHQDAIANTYEFLKNAIYRTIYRMFRGQNDLQALVYETLEKTPSIEELALEVAKHNPWLAQTLLNVCADFDFYLVLNQATHPEEASIGTKLCHVSHKLLGIDPAFAGILYHDSTIPTHAGTALPLAIAHPEGATCKGINRIAEIVLGRMIQKHDNQPVLTSDQILQNTCDQAKKDYQHLEQCIQAPAR